MSIWNVRNAETERHEAFVDVTLGVMWRPTGGVLEQADRANAAIGAEVEPVTGSPRDANEIAC